MAASSSTSSTCRSSAPSRRSSSASSPTGIFADRGIRDDVELTFVTPLDGAFTKPVASETLGGLLAEKHVELITEFAAGEVDGAAGVLRSWDEREVPFDLLVTIPLHGGAAFVERSAGLGDDLGFVPSDHRTLQSRAAPNVFVIGDAAALPTSKAGSVTHFEGSTLVTNVERFLAGEPLEASFDGHANCFIETGFSKALLIDFNYDTEPLPGPVSGGAYRPAAAAQGEPAQPHGQAHVRVGLLARTAAGPRDPRHQ